MRERRGASGTGRSRGSTNSSARCASTRKPSRSVGGASGVKVRVSKACYRGQTWTGKLRGKVPRRSGRYRRVRYSVSRLFTGESRVYVTFKVLDSLSATPRHAANPDPQGPARMPPASRGPPPLGDPDRRHSRHCHARAAATSAAAMPANSNTMLLPRRHAAATVYRWYQGETIE